MRLGLALGYWGAGPDPAAAERVAAAEDLGFDSIWTAEAYGSDALTPLAWLGARTSRVRLGTSVVQMSARTPTATAMAALTLDHLSGGRMVLGIGASGPQVVEGWYGQPYPKPLARTREYVQILRSAFARERVEFAGEHYAIPHPGGAGLGKPLRPTVHPLRTDLPILLAAEGPKNVALAAEIADGWQPLFYAPRHDAFYRDCLTEGFARSGARRTADDFEVVCMVQVVVDEDVDAAADRIRPMLALYIGGMGAKGVNFHYDVFARMGYEDECARIQESYLAGRKDEAAAAVPLSMVEQIALVGPRGKIAEELDSWRNSLVTTMVVGGGRAELEVVAELVG
ncbi:LLM class F420-dependent oxidoreductase [Pseudonocardia broussonetiae]|uniref:LLM class F420-dependent oxidoreductase n=1 Tax=Pseudonocardia broussonetiae TaxID=2736640 RepID=A0A6M6JEE9_9PSEU|nr:LLM class F420-dependent oxidoreductase [Pseudonocardia broussonetiae]QJY45435.1 LLM class F420-dependent oxidoreductase [Pseudonocardia broussonetiae]